MKRILVMISMLGFVNASFANDFGDMLPAPVKGDKWAVLIPVRVR